MLLLNSTNALLVLTFAINLIKPSLSTDFCSTKLCPRKNHIRCGHNGGFGVKCPKNAVEILITDELIKFIIDKHNEVRKGVSAGNYKGLETANRMIEMVM